MNTIKSDSRTINKVYSSVLSGIMATSILATGGQHFQLDRNRDNRMVFTGLPQMNVVRSKTKQSPLQENYIFSGMDYAKAIVVVDGEKMNNLTKINKIAALEDNWNNDGASAFSKQLISRARQIITCLSIQPEVFPTAADSIQMEFDGPDGSYLEIEIGESGLASVFSIDRQGKETTAEMEIDYLTINKLVENFYG